MDSEVVVGDVLEVNVDGGSESPSLMFARWSLAARFCREAGISKVLYQRRTVPSDRWSAIEAVKSLATIGFSGVRIAAVLPDNQAAYSYMFLEHIARRLRMELTIVADRSAGLAFLHAGDFDVRSARAVASTRLAHARI